MGKYLYCANTFTQPMIHHNAITGQVSIPAISGRSIGYDGFLSVSTVVFVWLLVLDCVKLDFTYMGA